MRTAEQIASLYEERKKRSGPFATMARTIRDIYNSDITLPLPEMDRNEWPAVANLLYQGIEQMAMRIASTKPLTVCPSLRPGIGVRDEKARDRSLIHQAWQDHDKLGLKMHKRARHMIAYSAAPVLMLPKYKTRPGCPPYPTRRVCDPLSTFASEMPAGEVEPDDCIFAYKRTLGWLKRRYPDAYNRINARNDRMRPTDEDPIEVLEYTDEENYVLVALADDHANDPTGRYVELERTENRLGRCWAVVPSRITLDRAKGQFDGVVGIYFAQAMLMSLELIGMKRAVYPEEWAEPMTAGVTANVTRQADPVKGIVGLIEDGRMSVHRVDPSVLNTQIIDRLERNIRVETSTPAELGGESTSNIRTGRRGDAIMAASVDFPVQMVQQIFEVSLARENEIAVAIDKAYLPGKKSFWISATKGQIEYTPADLWETDVNYVKYSQAGTDINSLVVAGLQRIGSGTMSKRSFMEIDPMVEDAESEHDRVQYEALEMAMLTSLQTRAGEDPTFAPVVADIAQKILTDKISVFEAYKIVDQQMKEQQAGLQAPQTPQEAAAQGQPGAAQPMAGINPPGPSQENLTQLLTSLKAGSRAVA